LKAHAWRAGRVASKSRHPVTLSAMDRTICRSSHLQMSQSAVLNRQLCPSKPTSAYVRFNAVRESSEGPGCGASISYPHRAQRVQGDSARHRRLPASSARQTDRRCVPNSDTPVRPCQPLRRPLALHAMSSSLRSYLGVFTIVLVGLSQPGWELAHAVAHGHEIEAYDRAVLQGAAGATAEGTPFGDHDHFQLGRAVTGKGTFVSGPAVTLVVDRLQPLTEAPVQSMFQSAALPRAGPRSDSTSRPRAPPIV
jgi:hypothetical protein